MNVLVIVVACGKEEQIAPGTETAFLTLGYGPVLVHSLHCYQKATAVDGIIVAVSKERVDATRQIIKRFGCTKVRGIVVGGVNRLSTLRTVFAKLPEPVATIIVQEASRPLVSPQTIDETIKAAKRYGYAIAAHKLPDAVKVAAKGMKPDQTLDRNTAWAAQTPQAFRSEVLEKIIDTKNKGIKVIDDESEWVRRSAEVHMVEAGYRNMKIRTRADLEVATAIFGTTPSR